MPLETLANDALVALIEETRQALATLRADDLEALTERAHVTAAQVPICADVKQIAAQHRLLADLLHETDRNLAVLRRLRGEVPERGARWAR